LRVARSLPEDSPFHRYPEEVLVDRISLEAALGAINEATGKESVLTGAVRLDK